MTAVTTLAERLGHSPDSRLVIINSDDLGLCHAANTGTYESLRQIVHQCDAHGSLRMGS